MAAREFNAQLLTPSDIGGVNRSRVIQAFCDHGPLSRADLAKMAGVTRATIGNIVGALLEAGIIEEREPAEGTGRVGKPARPLWFGPRAGLSGAVVLGQGRLEAALVNARGDLLKHRTATFDSDDPTGAPAIAAVVGTLPAVLPRRRSDVLGIGIAVPGACDTRSGRILGSGQIPGLRGKALVEAVTSKFGRRVLVDNDSRAQALGEKWFGAGRGEPAFASVQTGSGIGVGIVLNGAVHRGRLGYAGEAGHMSVVQDGDLCRCGLRGCWETIASLGWLQQEADARGLPRDIDAYALGVTDDQEARDLLALYADHIAIGLANLTQILSPGLFILHGDAVGGGEAFRAMVEERTKARVLGHMAAGLKVVLSELDQRAGLLGAAGLVLSETFHLSV